MDLRWSMVLFGLVGALSAVAASPSNLFRNGDFSEGMKFWTTTGVKARVRSFLFPPAALTGSHSGLKPNTPESCG